MKTWLGVDCGSVSIKFALIDENKKLVDSLYLRNRGIIDTVKEGLLRFYSKKIKIQGVGCTGSGRDFVSLLLGADIVKTEILAHAIAAAHYFPKVNTVFDIGGEDCKIIELKDGIPYDFVMNSVCGAGTGSVIENIASRLGIPIEEVGEIALQSKNNLDFPGKCGVFCQSAVVSKLNSGANKSDILKGVIKALVSNYLNISKGIQLKPPYVFQGATAKNKAVIRELEKQLNHRVEVPSHCAVMGAIGIALLAKESKPKSNEDRNFKINKYKSTNFSCGGCSNNCNIIQLYDGEKLLGAIGSRCGKWDHGEGNI